MNRAERWGLAVCCWLGAAARFRGLFANSFHPDEALFASWARLIAVWRDPLLQGQPVDKPPLLFYTQALFYPLFGPVTWAARLPNLLASVLLVPLVAIWAWRLYRDGKTAVFAALFLALSPLAIQFSATAFIDPLLIFWLVTAVTQQPRRPFASGFLFGLAVASKYQAVLWWPLLALLAWQQGWSWAQWRRWLAGLLPPLAALLLWSMARSGMGALWSAQMQNYGGLRLIWSWELWPRAQGWLQMGHWLWGNWVLFGLFGAGLLWLLVRQIPAQAKARPHKALDATLILFLLGYGVLHWLLAVPIWDRYLLPLLPLVAMLTGRIISALGQQAAKIKSTSPILTILLVFLLLPGAWGGMNGRFPSGGQRNADQGAAVVAMSLIDAPYGTVLYDHWWSWQWRYHLFDRRVFVNWLPYPAALAAELTVFGQDGNPRYLALPPTTAAAPFQRAVSEAGFRLERVTAAGDIVLYRILPINHEP
ncbi:MAG: glycosyltransferase family 39 protein [Anaerolineales bacterium]|nr:glycosyltransferase family 39 protein [Anaerolineales bacterium]